MAIKKKKQKGSQCAAKRGEFETEERKLSMNRDSV
jgi:hypothetical protein